MTEDPIEATGATPPTPPTPPTPEQIEARARRADKSTRGALAAVLCLEAFCVLLVPRAIAQTDVGLGAGKTWTLVGFALVLILAGFMQRRPWGIGLGSFLQLPLIATGVWTNAFFVIAALFIGIWLYVLNIRRELVGTPGDWRILIS
ncbi:uncharacterized protein DUF4233 [Jatrophihabitans sp. GAS493]|uniref:DUF4233 domain-containing protein n=1 Tax=Jatrophihabitans sp. GAS493 TaxID=1907575 RepID=UPI000BB7EB33|nr:DUF4233 domain-containing protein [Jatrophihabitans sp. GAS493]SOD72973.1 uncharacterized protein DUF4233 [Jatrophihabitans sp. GAS493]